MSERNLYKELYCQSTFPIFQNLTYETVEQAKACITGDIQLVEDLQTGLVFNASFSAEVMQYDANYQNEQALSPRFQQHLVQVAEIVERGMGRNSIVEVGCGKGYFLEFLTEKGFDITGFDPTYEGSNPKIIKSYFDSEARIQSSGLVLRHVLEHIEKPIDFLMKLSSGNARNGRVYIEVPCFDWICQKKAWFDIFYEHVNYFRLSDFQRMFGSIVDSGHVFGGQYIYVVAELNSLQQPMIDLEDRVDFPEDFSSGINRHNSAYSAVWGGASKGVIFSLLKARAGQPVDMVIDINPAKQGRYLPVTGLKVRAPADALETLPDDATIYVMNPNYIDEIRVMSGNKFKLLGADYE
jgi:SAM-dependent methyltransferase